MESLKEIERSLQQDAGLPKVPDVSVSLRTLQDVKAEIDAAIVKADELASTAVYLQGLVEKLTASLGKLEQAENALLEVTLKRLRE